MLFRLDPRVRPVEYKLRLAPHPTTTRTIFGIADISLRVALPEEDCLRRMPNSNNNSNNNNGDADSSAPVTSLTLNVLSMELCRAEFTKHIKINSDSAGTADASAAPHHVFDLSSSSKTQPADAELLPEDEAVVFKLPPACHLQNGESGSLRIHYVAKIISVNEDSQRSEGCYFSNRRGGGAGGDSDSDDADAAAAALQGSNNRSFDDSWTLATHLEPTHARQLFPCWDEPPFRAAFSLDFICPESIACFSFADPQQQTPRRFQDVFATESDNDAKFLLAGASAPPAASCSVIPASFAPSVFDAATAAAAATASDSASQQQQQQQLVVHSFKSDAAISPYLFSFFCVPSSNIHILSETLPERDVPTYTNAAFSAHSNSRGIISISDDSPLVVDRSDVSRTGPMVLTTVRAPAVPLRVVVDKKTQTGDGSIALQLMKRAILFYERALRHRLPCSKVDMIASQAFTMLGEENWSLILMADGFLCMDEGQDTARWQRIARLIAHEVHHQWFGNMSACSFTDLWIKEGQTRLMEFICLGQSLLFPSWHLMDDFYRSITVSTALDLDSQNFEADKKRDSEFGYRQRAVAIPESTPVREVIDLFDGVSYGLGGTYLRLLHDMIGGEQYLDALARFVTRFAWSHTGLAGFALSVEEAVQQNNNNNNNNSKKPLAWPVIGGDDDDGEKITLQQLLDHWLNKTIGHVTLVLDDIEPCGCCRITAPAELSAVAPRNRHRPLMIPVVVAAANGGGGGVALWSCRVGRSGIRSLCEEHSTADSGGASASDITKLFAAGPYRYVAENNNSKCTSAAEAVTALEKISQQWDAPHVFSSIVFGIGGVVAAPLRRLRAAGRALQEEISRSEAAATSARKKAAQLTASTGGGGGGDAAIAAAEAEEEEKFRERLQQRVDAATEIVDKVAARQGDWSMKLLVAWATSSSASRSIGVSELEELRSTLKLLLEFADTFPKLRQVAAAVTNAVLRARSFSTLVARSPRNTVSNCVGSGSSSSSSNWDSHKEDMPDSLRIFFASAAAQLLPSDSESSVLQSACRVVQEFLVQLYPQKKLSTHALALSGDEELLQMLPYFDVIADLQSCAVVYDVLKQAADAAAAASASQDSAQKNDDNEDAVASPLQKLVKKMTALCMLFDQVRRAGTNKKKKTKTAGALIGPLSLILLKASFGHEEVQPDQQQREPLSELLAERQLFCSYCGGTSSGTAGMIKMMGLNNQFRSWCAASTDNYIRRVSAFCTRYAKQNYSYLAVGSTGIEAEFVDKLRGELARYETLI